jgi:hypothetical protein
MTPKDAFYKVGTGIHRVIFNVSKGRIFGKAFGMPLIELVTTGRRSGMARATEGFCSRVEEGPDQGKLETPEISAGEVVELPLSIPADCLDSDCEIKFTIDANNQVVESDEANKTISVTCGGGVE